MADNKPMTEKNLRKIEALWAKTTPGPWLWDEDNAWITDGGDDYGNGQIVA